MSSSSSSSNRFIIISAAATVFAAALLVPNAHAYQTYVALNPNGASVGRPPVAAIGHIATSGGGNRNAYGIAFAANGHKWSKDLCLQDSDGDGYTNGFELGDPCCIWVQGQTPQITDDISHPGVASGPSYATPAVRRCTANTTCSNGVEPCLAPSASPSPAASPSPSPSHHNATASPSYSGALGVMRGSSSSVWVVQVIATLVIAVVYNAVRASGAAM